MAVVLQYKPAEFVAVTVYVPGAMFQLKVPVEVPCPAVTVPPETVQLYTPAVLAATVVVEPLQTCVVPLTEKVGRILIGKIAVLLHPIKGFPIVAISCASGLAGLLH